MIVHKFGGTSLGTAERFERTADIIVARHDPRRGNGEAAGTVVVVSAMNGVTNRLIAGARAAAGGRDDVCRDVKAELLSRHIETAETLIPAGAARLALCGLIEDRLHELERLYRSIALLGELTARGADAVASFGEPLSAEILAAVLRGRSLRSQALTAVGLIVTDDRFGGAEPLMEPTRLGLEQHVRPLIERGILPVITGYIAATERGVVTTLGRGGSDFSAAIIGAGLGAEEVRIWSDVDGILTADPNIVPGARTLEELSYSEASALAHFGADVLYPKTIPPLAEQRIPLRIVNSFNPSHPGTLIVDNPSPERERRPAIISSSGLSLVVLASGKSPGELGLAARALRKLSEAGIEVLMFSRSFFEDRVNLVVRDEDKAHSMKILDESYGRKEPDEINLEIKERVAAVSVAGGMEWNGRGLASRVFAALGGLGTRVIAVAQAAGGGAVSFCIPESETAGAVRHLHRKLGLEGRP